MTLRARVPLAFGASLAAVLLACSPDTVPARSTDAAADRADAAGDAAADAPLDGATPDGPAPDAAPDVVRNGPCGDGGVCGGGQRCDPARMHCVDCLATAHCGGATPVCASGRCVAATPCNSSRMCPGQVCDLSQSRCVDCVTDAECEMGQRCTDGVCATPATCRSSRDCSAAGLVCNVAQMRCVECLEDRDCAMGSACTAGNVCRVAACTPNARRCVSTTRVAVCDARGVTETETDCATGEVCTGGECRRLLCAPGSASCETTTARRTCNADGMAYTVAACASGESCIAGECRAPGCTPGAATCTSTTERRVCNADGMTFATMACPAGQMCSGGACAAPTCPTGQTLCGAACVSLQTDATNCGVCGRACPAGQTCAAGACAAPTDDIPPLNQARWGFGTVVQSDGRIFVIGGYSTTARTSAIGNMEVYDPATGRWTTRPTPFSLGNVSAVGLADGRIYVANGAQTGFIGQGYLYDVGMDRWTTSRVRVNDGGIGVARAQDGMVYVFGGGDNPARIRRYNPTDDSISTQAQTITPVRDPAPVLVPDGRLLLMGGDMSNNIPTYVPASGTAGSLRVGFASPRAAGAAVRADDGRIYYAGGFLLTLASTTMSFPDLYALDLTSNTMTALAPMPEPRTYFALVVRPGGRLTAIGGYSSSTMSVLASTRTYTVATNTWR